MRAGGRDESQGQSGWKGGGREGRLPPSSRPQWASRIQRMKKGMENVIAGMLFSQKTYIQVEAKGI